MDKMYDKSKLPEWLEGSPGIRFVPVLLLRGWLLVLTVKARFHFLGKSTPSSQINDLKVMVVGLVVVVTAAWSKVVSKTVEGKVPLGSFASAFDANDFDDFSLGRCDQAAVLNVHVLQGSVEADEFLGAPR
jgi:hypothetical protein